MCIEEHTPHNVAGRERQDEGASPDSARVLVTAQDKYSFDRYRTFESPP
jgi:hypothetical protein